MFLNKITISINKEYYVAFANQLVLNVLQYNKINIPFFCYHKNLQVAGNCRMCLVEIKGFAKLSVACATELKADMAILTDTKLVNYAREHVLEFLLCNHPLDCPICDQGGECDLQDQSYIFGRSRGRFYETKRAVSDYIASPLIKMTMTRCIHCTRCVRFFEEFSGNYLLGLINRGGNMQIHTYINSKLNFELASNVVDICPVGALTSKPNEFQGRPWEIKQYQTIDFFDSFCTDIRVDIVGTKLLRILPLTNETYIPWISDLTRNYVDVYKSTSNYINPYIYVKTKNRYVIVSLSQVFKKINLTNASATPQAVILDEFPFDTSTIHFNVKNFFLGNFLDLRTLTSVKQFIRITNLQKINIISLDNVKLTKVLLKNNLTPIWTFLDLSANYFYESTYESLLVPNLIHSNIAVSNTLYFTEFNNHIINHLVNSLVFIGINLRYEFPVLNSYITQYQNLKNKEKLKLGYFNTLNS